MVFVRREELVSWVDVMVYIPSLRDILIEDSRGGEIEAELI